MIDIRELAVTGLNLDVTRAITTDPIITEAEDSNYRVQTTGVHKDVESKLLTINHRQYPLRRVDGCEIPQAQARAITSRTFKPTQVGYQENFCYDDFNSTILALLLRNNLDASNLDGTQMGALLAEMTALENKKHLQSLSWFSQSAGTDPAFNQIKGYWEIINELAGQLFVPRLQTYAGAPLAAGDGVALMQSVIDQATDDLNQVAQNEKVFYIGRKVMQRLKADIIAGYDQSGMYQSVIENGVNVMRFDGIDIVQRNDFDQLGDSVLGLGANSNLVVLTKKQNMVWAINVNDGLSFEAYYSRDKMRYIMRNLFVFGVQIDYPTLLSVAY